MLDLLINGGVIHQANSPIPIKGSVGISGDRIAFLGDQADAPVARQTIEFNGELVSLGIIDSHNHLLLGFDSDAVNLQEFHSLEPMREALATFAQTRPDLTWVCGENANYSVVENRRPHARDLAGITDRPIFITTYDQHSVWLNEVALRLLGVEHGVNLSWGQPEFDELNQPTGWITDFYTSAMTTIGLKFLQRDIPMYSPDHRYRKLLTSMQMATRLGITTVVEPQVPLAE